MIGIIDYGMGNLASVFNAFKKIGCDEVKIVENGDELRKADKMILPGVGAFEDAMKNLRRDGFVDAIHDGVKAGKPLLGICLGFQLIFEKSYENGEFEGLGLFEGSVVRFETDLPVPHMGWNTAVFRKSDGIFSGMSGNHYFYFDHAYYPVPARKEVIVSTTEYGVEFASAVMRDNVCATQYHPEKSHKNGLKIVKAFSKL